MIHDEGGGGSSSVTSSPLQSFSLMSLSPTTITSPYPPWLRDLKSDERGLYLIHLLINCANHVASGSLDHAHTFLDHISILSSPQGDTMQRIASYFTEALARRILRSWPGLYRALTSTARLGHPLSETLQAKKHFLDLCPFMGISFLVSNQAILEAMEGEKMVHIVDLSGSADPSQWIALIKALNCRPDGPPHLRITGVHEHKEMLNHMASVLTAEAEKLDIPFQFNSVVTRLDMLDVESLKVKTGEALAISSVAQLHSLLAGEDSRKSSTTKTTPTPVAVANKNQFQRMIQAGQGTLGELMEKDAHQMNGHGHGHSHSPDSALSMWGLSSSSSSSSSPSPSSSSSSNMENFLSSLCGLSPKIMMMIEQESNHNGASLNERFMEALNFYAALFDCLESTVSRQSVERLRVEKMLFGEEINNIIACEGPERKERHEKLERWVQRLELAGFGRLPLSYYAMLQAKRSLMSYGCEGYQVKEDNGYFFICWQDRPLYSISAWSTCRRYD